MTEGTTISELGFSRNKKKHTTQYLAYSPSTSISLIIITNKPSQLIIP